MMTKPTKSKILSLLVVAAMVFTIIPLTGFAAAGENLLGDSGKIIVAAFDALPIETRFQTYGAGELASGDDLPLPDTLTGTDAEDNAISIDGVTWQSKPAFDPAAEAAYIFTAALPEGYALAEGVTAPMITVIISSGGMEIQPTADDTLNIGGQAGLSLATNQLGTGWTWTANTNTLTLDNAYLGASIIISCDPGDSINLVYSGNVTITAGGLSCNGSLTISESGGGGTLTCINSDSIGIRVEKDLEITSGTVVATGDGAYPIGIFSQSGNITINGNADVTASANGTDTKGIYADNGAVTIDTSGTVNATGTGAGYGIESATVTTISNGTVTVTGDVIGDLIVSGGTVVVTGTVSGDTNITGGDVTAPNVTTITSIAPASGPTTGGTTVTLTGTNLTGTTAVTVGGVNATSITNTSATQITFVTPAGAAGAKDVKVTTPGGSATLTNGFTFVPVIGGTASITGTSKIGQTLTADTTLVTGGSGAFSYQWKSGGANVGTNQNTYQIQGSDAGKAITCVITRAQASGSVTATFESGAVVPYTIAVSNSGNVSGDTAVTVLPDTGRAGTSIALNYALGGGNPPTINNTLTFTGATGLTNLTSAGASVTQNYTVKAADAVNGGITITATFLHTNLTPRTLTFSDPGPVTQALGSGSFTNAATPGAGSGTIAYSSSVPGVATVANNGTVTLIAAGQTTITATIAADANYAAATASYILTVNAANQPQTAPAAPTLASRTTSSITLNTIAANANGAAAQYSRNNGATWQDSPAFTGLSAGASYTFVARYNAVAGYNASPNSASASFSTESGGSDSSDSGSGGGGGGGTTSTTTAPATTWLEQTPAATLAGGAKSRGEDYVRTKSTGEYGVRGNAWARFAGLKYEHDTVSDGAVQVRLYINDPTKLTKDTLVSGYVKGSAVDKIKAFFEKWFKNKVRVVHLDRQGDFGQSVQIAARVDLTGMDTTKLYFYAYDKKTNSYRLIEQPAYWIDANGYLHFTTEYAGDIVISEGVLERK